MKKSKRKKKVGKSPVDIVLHAPKRMRSLSELEAEVCREYQLKVKVGPKEVIFPVRRLTPAETAQLEEILSEVQPPLKEVVDEHGKKQKEFDHTDVDYQKAARVKQIEARALACWWSCSLFREEYKRTVPKQMLAAGSSAEDPSRKEIVAFVQSKLTESILNQIYQVARSEDLELESLLNFS